MNANPSFVLMGEPLALDLINTRILRGGEPLDLLADPEALTAWLHLERPRLSWTGRVAAPDLIAVRALRAAMDELLRAQREGRAPQASALALLNQALAWQDVPPQLAWGAQGPRLRHRSDSHVGALLKRLATDAVALLAGPLAARVRECAHPGCCLQFLARNPRRRWCSADCGNRARVARHYSKRHRGT